jgi:hypothetical protein
MMANKKNKALVKHKTRAAQRDVDRHTDLMHAREDITEEIIESGTEVHNLAAAKNVEAALFEHMILDGASKTLNGSYAALEEDCRRQSAAYREFLFQCTGRYMANSLRQAESMPIVPEKGVIAQLGDGFASARDELDRLKGG